jgi:sulfite reductase beta subunit-like hemoprotein
LLAGTATALVVAPSDAAQAAVMCARAFIALVAAEAPGAWRVSDLRGGGRRLAQHLGLELRQRSGARTPTTADAAGRRPGVVAQRDGRAAVSALPALARLEPEQLRALAEALAPGRKARLSPWRTITFVDVPATDAGALAAALDDLGLVLAAASGWTGLSACAGLGACSRARADVRAAAALRAARRGDAAPREHWSGCERRCGEPRDAAVTVVATAAGLHVTRGAEESHGVATPTAAVELLSPPREPA